MCYLCDEYGDPNYGDGVWYLNPYNYAMNMYKLRLPGEGYKGAEASRETGVRQGPTETDLVEALEKGDQQEVDRIKREITEIQIRRGSGGQVLPMKEADKVLTLLSHRSDRLSLPEAVPGDRRKKRTRVHLHGYGDWYAQVGTLAGEI